MKHVQLLLTATSFASLPSPAASSIVAGISHDPSTTTARAKSTGRSLFSPITGGIAFNSSALNDTELIAKFEKCVATQDARKSDFLAPYLTPEFLNSTTCLDPDGSLGARGSDPTVTWLFTFGLNSKLLLDTNLFDEYIGSDPTDTKLTDAVRKLHNDVQWFWGLSAEMRDADPLIGQMPLKGIHTTFYANDDGTFKRTVALFPGLTGFPADKFPPFPTIQGCVNDFIDNPGLTFNAKYIAPVQTLPGVFPGAQIVWGDGIVEFIQAISADEDDALLRIAAFQGHEYAHHVGILIGNVPIASSIPEETRFSELLTDSLSAYWNAHACGNSYDPKDMEVVADTFAAVGDCNFDNPTHHGTSDQRKCAARWGAYLALESVEVMEPSSIISRFQQDLVSILSVDMEGACPNFTSVQGMEAFSEDMECPWVRQPTAVRRSEDSDDGGRDVDGTGADMDENMDDVYNSGDTFTPSSTESGDDDTTSGGYVAFTSPMLNAVIGGFAALFLSTM